MKKLEVTYSYWDGSGHRYVIEVTKGTTIGKFLEAVKQQIVKEFTELRSTSAEDLMYVKEDLIIPQVSITPSLFCPHIYNAIIALFLL